MKKISTVVTLAIAIISFAIHADEESTLITPVYYGISDTINISSSTTIALANYLSSPQENSAFALMTEEKWCPKSRKGDVAFLVEEDGTKMFRLTDSKTQEASCFTFRERLPIIYPFKLSFDYCADGEGWMADGFACAFHTSSKGTNSLGAAGNYYGVGGNSDFTAVSPSAGFWLQYYGKNKAGVVTNGARTETCDPDDDMIFRKNWMHIEVVYDGASKMEMMIYPEKANPQKVTRDGNLARDLGAKTAYFGFYGSTGGVASRQRIKNVSFSLEQYDFTTATRGVDGLLDENHSWVLNSFGKPETDNFEMPTLSREETGTLTLNSGEIKNAATSATIEKPLFIASPFTLSFTYRAQKGIASDTLADGFACVFHRDSRGASAVGAPRGDVGVSGNSSERISPSRGFGFTFYNEIYENGVYRGVKPLVKNVVDGNLVNTEESPAVIATDMSARDVHITMEYIFDEEKILRTTFSRDGYEDIVISQNVDLVRDLGGDYAFLTLTGGTGGGVVNQFIRDFEFKSIYSDWDGYNFKLNLLNDSSLVIATEKLDSSFVATRLDDLTIFIDNPGEPVRFKGEFSVGKPIKLVLPFTRDGFTNGNFNLVDLSESVGLSLENFILQDISGKTMLSRQLIRRGSFIRCSSLGFSISIK